MNLNIPELLFGIIDKSRTRLSKRRTPRVSVVPASLHGGRDGRFFLVLAATTQIRRRKRKPQAYLVTEPYKPYRLTGDPAEATDFDTEGAEQWCRALIQLGKARE